MKKKILLGLGVGVVSILVIQAISIILSFFYSLYSVQTIKNSLVFVNHTSLPLIIFSWFILLLSYAAFIVAGFICVKIIKRNGLLYGASVGFLWFILFYLVSFGITLYVLSLPNSKIGKYPGNGSLIKQNYINNLTKNIPQKIAYISISISLATLGGFLAEKTMKKKF